MGENLDAPVLLARFEQRHDAEYARGFLEDRGIPSVLQTDDAAGLFGGISFFRRARLLVRTADLDDARRALRDAGLGPDSEDAADGPE